MSVYEYKIKRKNFSKKDRDKNGYYTWYQYQGKYKNTRGELRTYSKSGFETKELCEQAEVKFLYNIKEKAEGNIELNELWEEYYAYSILHKEESTCATDNEKYSNHIKSYFGNHFIKDISAKDIIDWQSHLLTTLEDGSVRNVHKVFNKILVYADRIYNTKWIPTSKVGAPRRKGKKKEFKFWSEHEFRSFYSVIENLEHKTLFMMLYFCGLRRGELLALKWNDIFNNFIRIDESCANINGRQVIKAPKNSNSYRMVELDDYTQGLLSQLYAERLLSENFRNDDFIFGRIKKPMAFNTLWKLKQKYMDEAEVEKIRLHDFRHSHVTHLINNGMPIPAIAARIGDSIREVLKTYAHVLPESNLEIKLFINKITEHYTT